MGYSLKLGQRFVGTHLMRVRTDGSTGRSARSSPTQPAESLGRGVIVNPEVPSDRADGPACCALPRDPTAIRW